MNRFLSNVAKSSAISPTLPLKPTSFICASSGWADTPLVVGASYDLKLGPQQLTGAVERIERVIDVDALTDQSAEEVTRDEIADVVIRTNQLVALD